MTLNIPRRLPALVLSALLPLALTACGGSSGPVDTDSASQDSTARTPPPPPKNEHKELLNAVQAPLDKAHAVEGQVLDAAQKQREDIDEQSGD